MKVLDDLEKQGEDLYLIVRYRGLVCEVRGQYAAARRHYERALRLDPRGTLALGDMGDQYFVYRDRPAPGRALAYYQEALSLLERGVADKDSDMESFDLYPKVIGCLLRLGRVREARRVGARAIRRHPELAGDTEMEKLGYRDPDEKKT